MNNQEILVQLLLLMQDQVHPLKKQEENLKMKLHQQYDDLELQINQNYDQQKDISGLIQIMEDTDQIYINCQKLEFLIRIMNLIIKIIQSNLFQQYDLNKYLTYLKYMIVQYFNNSQFDKIQNKIDIYYLNLSFIIKGNNKLDFFTTKENLEKSFHSHTSKKLFQSNRQLKTIKIPVTILKTSYCFSQSQQCEKEY
ncbi:hypothetical protein pb186bvf_002810 [Paramecium bursaria]